MKNVLISSIYAPTGGVKTMRDFIIDTLQQEGFCVSVAYYQPYSLNPELSVPLWKLLRNKPGFKEITSENVKVYEIGCYFPEFEFNRYENIGYWKEIAQNHDIFISISGYALPAYPFVKLNLPFIGWFATTYSDDRVGREMSLSRKFIELINYPVCRKLEKKVLASNNYCFALSEYTQKLIVKDINKSLDILSMPIDTNIFSPPPQKKEELSIILAGRFEDSRKNFALALEVIHYLVTNKKLNVKFYAAGDKPSPKTVKQVTQLQLENNVCFLDYLSREELACYYQKSQIFLLTSFQEGLGIVIFEAMACGAVPVVTKCGGPESTIHNDLNGFIVDFSVSQIGETIYSTLTNSKSFDQLSENAIQTVKENFSYSVLQEKFLNAFYHYNNK